MIDQTFFVIKLSQGQESVDHRMILSKSFDKSWSDDLDKITSIKVKGKTAIPTGRYLVTKTLSVRFKRNMYLLNNVPGFAGIRIHSGNTAEDTEGCLILGKNKVIGKVVDSKVTVEAFEKILDGVLSKEKIFITIV